MSEWEIKFERHCEDGSDYHMQHTVTEMVLFVYTAEGETAFTPYFHRAYHPLTYESITQTALGVINTRLDTRIGVGLRSVELPVLVLMEIAEWLDALDHRTPCNPHERWQRLALIRHWPN